MEWKRKMAKSGGGSMQCARDNDVRNVAPSLITSTDIRPSLNTAAGIDHRTQIDQRQRQRRDTTNRRVD